MGIECNGVSGLFGQARRMWWIGCQDYGVWVCLPSCGAIYILLSFSIIGFQIRRRTDGGIPRMGRGRMGQLGECRSVAGAEQGRCRTRQVQNKAGAEQGRQWAGDLASGIWALAPGTRHLAPGAWQLESGIWNLESGGKPRCETITNKTKVSSDVARRLGRRCKNA
jgi:hypothetical protein